MSLCQQLSGLCLFLPWDLAFKGSKQSGLIPLGWPPPAAHRLIASIFKHIKTNFCWFCFYQNGVSLLPSRFSSQIQIKFHNPKRKLLQLTAGSQSTPILSTFHYCLFSLLIASKNTSDKYGYLYLIASFPRLFCPIRIKVYLGCQWEPCYQLSIHPSLKLTTSVKVTLH